MLFEYISRKYFNFLTQATKTFLEAVNKLRKRRSGTGAAVSLSTAIKFLSARKFEVSRAITLFEQHEITRQREGLVDLNPNQEPLKSELATGKFTILVSILFLFIIQ